MSELAWFIEMVSMRPFEAIIIFLVALFVVGILIAVGVPLRRWFFQQVRLPPPEH
jgi:hypothetical protein